MFYAQEKQSWLYGNLTGLWAPDVGHDSAALATIKRGGYYATNPTPKLTVVSLNVNFWVDQNPAAKTDAGAKAEGEKQFQFLEQTLEAASAAGRAVHILGHQPPVDTASPLSPLWLPHHYARFSSIISRYKTVVRGMFFGHIHTDQFTILRECRNTTHSGTYKETTGIKWCSGGGDYAPGDVFEAGLDGLCPLVPSDWSTDHAVTSCEKVCDAAKQCLGFTLYFNETQRRMRECCFRTGSTAYKPADPTSTARCYEKPPSVACDGEPLAVFLPGPSLTEGWPATNPAVRLLEFDPDTYELADMRTYNADLHHANAGNELQWRLEYSFRSFFGMDDLSPKSFAELVSQLADAHDPAGMWHAYRGRGDGCLFCSGYESSSAPFAPIYPCKPCVGQCKTDYINALNGTSVM